MTTACPERLDLEALDVYTLARLAEVGDPDRRDSPGAVFLLGVRDDIAERLRDDVLDTPGDLEHHVEEVAREALPVNTYGRWRAFADLCLWQDGYADEVGLLAEPLAPAAEEWGEGDGLTYAASVLLEAVARRLALLLVKAAAEGLDDEGDLDEVDDVEAEGRALYLAHRDEARAAVAEILEEGDR
ncbi:hypothetical protein [Knoellia koreensis]|uniref:Uncharacterized protein n=1 Tax=Knoellia koreensis TaxID=2730921 RepID=A0A849HIJ8_9MICO|nr:hypothetical protein [Knoellia sp. DB2414S]NNM44517.1 hypothetical protein [Knoellia sp. DB2414S]